MTWDVYKNNTSNARDIDLDRIYFRQQDLSIDSNGDGSFDHLDIDKDNDGITDNVEAQATADYVAASGIDVDGDGLDDAWDADTTSTDAATSVGLTEVDTDNDGTVDTLDTDSDDDGITDAEEAGHGVSQTDIDASADTDGDGLMDVVEGSDSDDGFDVNDENLDGTGFTLADSDNDVAADGSNADPSVGYDLDYRDDTVDTDTDGDGVVDRRDIDDDNDGILDFQEAEAGVRVRVWEFPARGELVDPLKAIMTVDSTSGPLNLPEVDTELYGVNGVLEIPSSTATLDEVISTTSGISGYIASLTDGAVIEDTDGDGAYILVEGFLRLPTASVTLRVSSPLPNYDKQALYVAHDGNGVASKSIDDIRFVGESTNDNATEQQVLDASESDYVTLTVNDQGNTGSDPGLTGTDTSEEGSGTLTVNITAVNDAPVVTAPPTSTAVTHRLIPQRSLSP